MSEYEEFKAVIAEMLDRPDLTAEDLLFLTIARRVNGCPDSSLKDILGGAGASPLNIRNRR